MSHKPDVRRRTPRREADPEAEEDLDDEDEDGLPPHLQVFRAWQRGAVWEAIQIKWLLTEAYAARVVALMLAGRESEAARVPVCRVSKSNHQVYQQADGKWVAVFWHNPHDLTLLRLGAYATESAALAAWRSAEGEGKMRII